MDREQTLALFASGKESWTAWALNMQRERKELEDAGTWLVDSEGNGRNDETRAWLSDAAIDFSTSEQPNSIENKADFSGLVFPGSASFAGITFNSSVSFAGSQFLTFTTFEDAKFLAEANFNNSKFAGFHPGVNLNAEGSNRIPNAQFSRNVDFTGAQFWGAAGFRKVIFERTAWFNSTTFRGEAWFREVEFLGDAPFWKANFLKTVWFLEAKFQNEAWFKDAIFRGDAEYSLAHFFGGATFDSTHFFGSAIFRAAQCAGSFSFDSTTFELVPDFVQAHFSEAPQLDQIRIVRSRLQDSRLTARRYRALKRLAIQGQDYARETDFFAGEIRALRGNQDRIGPNPLNLLRLRKQDTEEPSPVRWCWSKPRDQEFTQRMPVWPGGLPGSLRYWFGLWYEWLSNFGRSLILPPAWWVLSTITFALIYLRAHSMYEVTLPASGCIAGPGSAMSAAIGLSIRKGLVFAGLDSNEKLSQIYACLYGLYPLDKAKLGDLPDSFTPIIPDPVANFGMLQSIISTVLIFLMILAIRNLFRIK